MRTYLVEAYLPRARAAELDAALARLVAVTREASPRAGEVRYVRSTFIPEDEVCFHVFEAVSEAAVRDVGERAALTFDRVMEAREGSAGAAFDRREAPGT